MRARRAAKSARSSNPYTVATLQSTVAELGFI